MERESFENVHTAEMLNRHFISIKVDKEERPDIDGIYMEVCQMQTGSGGWPLSVFLLPDQKPFFAGTYFPDLPRYGMPSFSDVLQQLSDLWEHDRKTILKASKGIMDTLRHVPKVSEQKNNGDPIPDAAEEMYQFYKAHFDHQFGGLQGAPKFPTPHYMYFLMRYGHTQHNTSALEMVNKTLTSMYEGGIYDHIGGGFSRYSTDEKWLEPHFEKMLYDNALLSIAYTEAFQITQKPLYRSIVEQTITFIHTEMTDDSGGFYTALDADSEGEEGKYYVWSQAEVLDTLGEKDGHAFCEAYDITEKGNFNEKSIPNLIKKKHPSLTHNKATLLRHRRKRTPPHRDDKILTGQNGMMIAACCLAAKAFQSQQYMDMAEKALSFIHHNLLDENARLYAVYRDGQAKLKAYAEDYVYLIWALMEAYDTVGKKEYLSLALQLNTTLLDLFWDQEEGGLFVSGTDAEKLITRQKNYFDNAYPSANSVCAMNLIRLSRLTDDSDLEAKAHLIIKSAGAAFGIHSAHLASAGLFVDAPYQSVHIVGQGDFFHDPLVQRLHGFFNPFCVVRFHRDETIYKMQNGQTTAYVCHNTTCLPGVTDPDKLADIFCRK